jgi:hypothetical protein
MNDFSPPPPPTPACHDWMPSVAMSGTLARAGQPCGDPLSVGTASHLGLPSHTPSREKAAAVQCQPRSRATASGFWLPSTGPIKDSHPLSFIHVQRTASPSMVALGLLRRLTGMGNPSVPASGSGTACAVRLNLARDGRGKMHAHQVRRVSVSVVSGSRPRCWQPGNYFDGPTCAPGKNRRQAGKTQLPDWRSWGLEFFRR